MQKVLLIEDEEFVRDLYKRQLDKANLPTDAFGNGMDGLKAAKENTYDIVLLDIMQPDVNGIDILKSLKQEDRTKNIPVVMLTNLGQDSVIKEAFNIGAIGYLLKASLTPDQMIQEVKKLLNEHQSASQGQPTLSSQPSQNVQQPPSPSSTSNTSDNNTK